METVETGKDKVKKICEVLRRETLEPAMEEAQSVVDLAEEKAEQVLKNAREKAAQILKEGDDELKKKQAVFEASLKQGARQSVEWLKQEIEEKLLNGNLLKLITKSTSGQEVLADLVKALIKAVEDEGLATDLSAVIPSSTSAESINELLGKELVNQLKEKSVLIGPMKGGVELKLHKEKITIDMTDTALLELLLDYVRKDFHKYFFAADNE